MQDIGFVGLGQMGSAMAERLCGPDWRLHVHDPSDEAVRPLVKRGAVAHASPAAVADVAPVVLACLPSQAVSLPVATRPSGIVDGRAIRVYAEMSTIGEETLQQIEAALGERGIRTIDTPVTGGPPVARAGNLTIMLAGDDEPLGQVRPALSANGRKRTGGFGAGS